MTQKAEMLSYALRYAELGWGVIPLRNKDKRPLLQSWAKYQQERADEEQIKRWWEKWPDANIAIVTGQVSGIVVIDVDGPEGLKILQEKGIPNTVVAKTGKGYHYYFKHPGGGTEIRSFTRRFPGLDLRGDGGYVVAPPSVHPLGHRYEWENPPWTSSLAELPAWILQGDEPEQEKEKKEREIREVEQGQKPFTVIPLGIPEGQRNDTLFRFACGLVGKGYDPVLVEAAVKHAAEHCNPPLPKTEAQQIVKSALRYYDACEDLGEVYKQYQDKLDKRYCIRPPGVLCYTKFTARGEKRLIPLANFVARPVKEVVRDDGVNQDLEFEIEGVLAGGRKLPRIRVPAKDFPSLSWVIKWGAGANVEPGQGAKDRVRHAIQSMGLDIPRETIYAHLGWRKVNDKWLYLHAGGAIGEEGPVSDVLVDIDQQLHDYRLPEPPSDPREAVRTSLRLLEVAPEEITFPLLAAAFRAPLGEAYPIGFYLFLAGPTGAKKTELTALIQGFWGANFHSKNLPGGWASTANSLERMAFLAKDAVYVIDDFAPTGEYLHLEADRILRAQGNMSGRARLRPDGSLKPRNFPRCLIVSSGEDIPRGQSLRARGLIQEVEPGVVDIERLTELQAAAREGVLASAMSAYIKWLAGRMDKLKKFLQARHIELRKVVRKRDFAHDRTPDLTANLLLGLEQFLVFCGACGVMTREEQEKLWKKGVETLLRVTERQAGYLETEDPVERFLALFHTALSSGRAHLSDASHGGEPENPQASGWRQDSKGDWHPLGEKIGWRENGSVILDPDATYAVVQRLARDQGSGCLPTQRVLWKRLAERGLILTREEGNRSRFAIKRIVEGQRRRVIVLLEGIDETQTPGEHEQDERKTFAESFLLATLETGPKQTLELLEEAQKAGITTQELLEAKQKLRVKVIGDLWLLP